MALNLNATLQGLTTKLLNYANLTVLDTTGVTNNFVRFSLPPDVDKRELTTLIAGELHRLPCEPLHESSPDY